MADKVMIFDTTLRDGEQAAGTRLGAREKLELAHQLARLNVDIIEAGFDILNPVQLSAANMDPVTLKSRFGDRIAFWGGGVDTQRTLPFGTAPEVRWEVADRVKILGPGGGFVFNPIHNVQARTPVENVLAMYETLREHGHYPMP